jgi:hypothetical protein
LTQKLKVLLGKPGETYSHGVGATRIAQGAHDPILAAAE